ncbi:efflux RND transporter permease subunit [Thiomonas arsenitoxydans]|uniref:efflux RND transporter permease subunit n=1 Tax=Thiomonas arsenitoxydans (strain DSM 22701 / CIP 110005 / 3As) TaxID=426114 RepID=UPI001ACCAC53|nr:efflux RND transporter permease subunit [Thiomonas arsenitoxydans]MBN8777731.1 efflux RND transporter permease subunit [Thiomonas arsenitoxydans]
MNFMQRLLGRPHAIIAIALLVVVAGIAAYFTMPMNLFPDSNRPMITVVTQWPGAEASDVEQDITHPIETQLSAIDGVRRVTSVSRDQVSAVTVEFEYGNDINIAATKVLTELKRVESSLPAGSRAPVIFRITNAAQPVTVLALTPAPQSNLGLSEVRRIAENQLRDRLLRIPGVAEVEVFGGHERQAQVDLDRSALASHHLNVAQVAAALAASNITAPQGLVHRDGYRFLLTLNALAHNPQQLAEVQVPVPGGGFVRVGDLGKVGWGDADPTSLYRGNGKEAIAVSLLRGDNGYAATTARAIDAELPKIEAQFPMLHIAQSDGQLRLIDLTVENMLGALRDALIMTVFVILLFLADTRAAFITALSLPFTYLLTFLVMKLIGYEFDMITLTAIIIAVGLLADDAIVVIENIERRMREHGESGFAVAANGTQEVMLAVLSGTLANAVVLLPIVFIGGFVQTVLRPLSVSLMVALAASFIVAVTIIPLLTPWLLKPGARDPLRKPLSYFDRWVIQPLKRFYAATVGWALEHPKRVLFIALVLTVVSLKQLPVVGRELMPLMDSGISQISFEAQPDTDAAQMQHIAKQVDAAIRASVKPDWLLSTSTVVGAEPQDKSFGAARIFSQGMTTVNLVDRFHRDETIFQINKVIQDKVRAIPGVIDANAVVYGATPLSSIRGTVDLMVSGPDWRVLDQIAGEIEQRLAKVGGLTGFERSWQGDSKRLQLDVDAARASNYGLTPGAIAQQVAAQVNGIPGGSLRVEGENSIPVWVRLRADERSSPAAIAALNLTTPNGAIVPLAQVATVKTVYAPTSYTHQNLVRTVDVIGYRRNIAVTALDQHVTEALKGLQLPRGYTISDEGEMKEMNESFTRLGQSLAFGIVLLAVVLVIAFRSFITPIAILVTLPLSVIGAAWAMLIADKHGCMPSFMGLILLMGIIVKNGILLVDFAQEALGRGVPLKQAILQAVDLRTRPILMTAAAAAVGMVPVAFEWAVGLERLSPLAVVAIGGLIVGTFLTLLIVPVLLFLLLKRRYPETKATPTATSST